MHTVSIYYSWEKYLLPSYSTLLDLVKETGHKPIETIEKIYISEYETKTIAKFYYVRP